MYIVREVAYVREIANVYCTFYNVMMYMVHLNDKMIATMAYAQCIFHHTRSFSARTSIPTSSLALRASGASLFSIPKMLCIKLVAA